MKEVKSFYISRRRFLELTGVAGAALALPGSIFSQDVPKKSDQKLKIACIGVGGQGKVDVEGFSSEQFVAFCDVDDARAATTYAAFPNVPRFKDYRVMLDKMDKDIEAVTITTPDHLHFAMAMEAVSRGKHVYVQKPAVQTMEQARKLLKAARKHKVVTQMGNQGHSSGTTRLVYEWVTGGALGTVKEVNCWTTRPVWPQGMQKLPEPMPVPEGFDWKLWQGGVTDVPYSKAYLPFDWRGWYSYGTGSLGDMGCHIMDAAYWSLDLRGPCKVSAQVDGWSPVAYPNGSIVTFEFPKRKGRAALKLTWYDGSMKEKSGRPEGFEPERQLHSNGSCIVGEKASILIDEKCQTARIIPEKKMLEMLPNLPPKTLERRKGGHYKNWIEACKGLTEACSNFEYAMPLTELCIMGSIAQRLPGETLSWDGDNDFGWFNKANKLLNNMQPQV